MTSKLTREENVQAVFDLKAGYTLGLADVEILKRVARMELAAMDSEPVAWEVKGILCHTLEEASKYVGVPEPLYADPRPEPASAEPVAWLLSGGGTKNVVCFDSGNAYADPLREVTPLYRHAQPVPASEPVFFIEVEGDDWINAGRIPGSTFDFNNLPDGINNLYAAPQPAPVVGGEPVAKKVTCWSCRNEVEISAIGDCDGYCPKCDTPIDLDEEPYTAPQRAPSRDQVRREHAEWSQATFGNVGPVGPLKHLSKEALEAAAEPGDLSEWADMQFLLWDAQRRAGITDEQITQAMIEKLAVNKQREWPEPKDGEPRLHIK